MFAPYYRQITFSVYSLPDEEAKPYLAMAYGDVKAAFEQLLAVTDPQRPILLAGFSKGSQLMLMLMEDLFDDGALQSRLVVAYAIGWRVTEEDLQTYPWLKMAQDSSDIGVIIAFNSEAEGVSESMLVPAGCFTYSINPLNWKTDSTEAPAEMNLGACFTN